MNDEMILVTGATGKTGRRVARRLHEQGVPVRAASPSSPVRLDWNDRGTWDSALAGVTGVHLVVPDLGSVRAAENLTAFTERAATAGVRRAVLVSFPPSGIPGLEPEHVAAAEQAPARAGLETTVLRPRWFFQNFSEDFLRDTVLSGDVRLPAGDGKEAFVDADDIADVAVTALTRDGHARRSYELSGPRLMSFAEAVADIARATGRPIGYTPLSARDYAAEQRAHGVPGEWVRLTVGLYSHVRSGALGSVTGDVERVLGRPPRDFADYARHAAAQGAWST
ncbi:NAD(P)H-binding protein [Nocardiopsis sp. CT-R113]|uniref:NAD(P)H-binding protein n=1 Tax=Nocardiopsis codii TaxID=3065942 RepID=A0ABU7K6Q5_9ACTN|nr:NAD(P)H-binding protein [Nocardiopsis sp. CT-R113]MEE2037924.1 NAD(P)H-binding protein [Nocardiopsis sp. CT-R113]